MGLSSILSQLARMSLAGLRLHPPLLLFDVSFDFPFWFDTSPDPPTWRRKVGKKCIKVPEIPSSPAACACSSLSRSNLCLPLSFPHSLKERHLTPCALSADYSSSHSLIVAGIILRPQMDLGSFSFSQTVAFSCSTSFPSTLRERKSVCSAALSVVGGGSEVAVTNEVLPRQVELRLQLTGQDEWESRRPTTSPKSDFLIFFFFQKLFSLIFRTWRAKHNSESAHFAALDRCRPVNWPFVRCRNVVAGAVARSDTLTMTVSMAL